jgi:hypothetical protein
MLTMTVDHSMDVSEAYARFMASLGSWVDVCIERYADAPATDVHDQGTYTTGWVPYVREREDVRALNFLKERRDAIRDHFVATGEWHHGYWGLQEAHHGTEHFELFLGSLLDLDSGDVETRRQILDATEHIGNWADDIPDWFDADAHLFRSMYLGTREIRLEPGMELNIPDHMRFVSLCLLALKAGGGQRYLDLASDYAGQWADAILAGDPLPVGILPGGPVTDLTGRSEDAYRSFAGMAGHLDDDVDRVENLLASNGVDVMLDLWQKTGRTEFRSAVERLLDVLATQLDDPDAGAAADAIRTYRRATHARRYDDAIRHAVASLDPLGIRELGLQPDVDRSERPHGIGKRSDKPNWFEDGKPQRHNPILLAVAAEVMDEDELATAALDLGRAAFDLARQALPDGRHHGCAANTVSAIARGHGRDNHAGVTTAILGALSLGEDGRPIFSE